MQSIRAEEMKELISKQRKGFNWIYPPLPLVGMKARRWWREIQAVSSILPKDISAFDAFGGSFSVSRILKDMRPDIDVTVNDCDHLYTNRLKSINQTAELWETLNKSIKRDEKTVSKFVKFRETEEALFHACLDKAEDKATVMSWGNGYGSLRNKVPKTPPNIELAKKWTDGLTLINAHLSRESHASFCGFSFYILDPPYTNTNKRNRYVEATKDAREWCLEIINSKKPYVLWDLYESDLLKASLSAGGLTVDVKVMGNTGKNTNKEMMTVYLDPLGL